MKWKYGLRPLYLHVDVRNVGSRNTSQLLKHSNVVFRKDAQMRCKINDLVFLTQFVGLVGIIVLLKENQEFDRAQGSIQL